MEHIKNYFATKNLTWKLKDFFVDSDHVQRLIKCCGDVKAGPTEKEEIQFLCLVCAKLKETPYLINFFLEVRSGVKSETSYLFNLWLQHIQSVCTVCSSFIRVEVLRVEVLVRDRINLLLDNEEHFLEVVGLRWRYENLLCWSI